MHCIRSVAPPHCALEVPISNRVPVDYPQHQHKACKMSVATPARRVKLPAQLQAGKPSTLSWGYSVLNDECIQPAQAAKGVQTHCNASVEQYYSTVIEVEPVGTVGGLWAWECYPC